MKSPLANIIHRSALRQMTDARSFKRGEDYFHSGRVRALIEDNGVLSAKAAYDMGFEITNFFRTVFYRDPQSEVPEKLQDVVKKFQNSFQNEKAN